MQKMTFSFLKILDPQIRSLSPTSALIVARVQFEAAINGKKIEGEQSTSTVWVNQGGRWLAQLHTASFRQ